MSNYKTELLEKKETAYRAARRLLDTAKKEKRELTHDEDKAFEQHSEDMRSIGEQVARIDAETASGDQAVALLRQFGDQSTLRPVFGETRSDTLVPSRAEYQELASEQRALGSSSAGVLLATAQANQWFDRLRAKSVFLASGPRFVTIAEHAERYPVISSSVTVGARNDTDAIAPSDPGLSSVTLEPVSYAAMTLVANEVLADSNGQARDIVSADLLRQAASKIEGDLFTGTGAASPKRIYGLLTAAGTQTLAAAGALTIDKLLTVQSNLEAAGADRSRIAFYLNPAGWASIRGTKDTAGRYLLMPDLANADKPTLFGSRVYVTANMPAANALAVDLDQVIVGVGEDVNLAYSEDYAFNTNSTAIRLTTRIDLGIINAQAVHKVTGIV